MKLTQEQKDKIDKIIKEEVLYEAKTATLIDMTIRHIKEVVGKEWLVMYKPVDETSSREDSVEFVIANKERVYTITLAPNNFNTEDKEW